MARSSLADQHTFADYETELTRAAVRLRTHLLLEHGGLAPAVVADLPIDLLIASHRNAPTGLKHRHEGQFEILGQNPSICPNCGHGAHRAPCLEPRDLGRGCDCNYPEKGGA
jgi:hypothetical protein